MLTIKRYSIDNEGEVFNHILLDTEPFGYLSNLDRLFREEFIIKKLGLVNLTDIEILLK